MIKIGLTGNICSGYEKIALMFKTLGVTVFDADIALKFLLNYREDIAKKIRIEFGENVYNKGLIDGSKFNTTEKFDRLIDTAELELIRLYESWRFVNKDESYTVFKSSILFERKLNKNMNYNISVFRPKDDRAVELSKSCIRKDSIILQPMMLSGAYSIIDSEMDELIKNQNSDFIIHNYESSASLLSQVKLIHEKIEAKSIKSILDRIDFGSVKNMLT